MNATRFTGHPGSHRHRCSLVASLIAPIGLQCTTQHGLAEPLKREIVRRT